VLLDVVMASDDDGLQVVRWLRKDRRDRLTRIVLRTVQPGLAPERDVMLEYDINDYQPKAELSAQ
jgi:CheY-like chemotaxis protein